VFQHNTFKDVLFSFGGGWLAGVVVLNW